MSQGPSSKDQFGPVAEKYLTSAVHASGSALQRLVEVASPSGGRVLDVGTGAGHMAYTFAPLVDEVVAFDLTPEMLRVVEREAGSRGLGNISTVEGDAEAMPFGDGEFDGVTCRVAAHHFVDVPAFVGEVSRVLRAGGWLLLVDTISPEDDGAALEVNAVEAIRDPSHVRNWKVSEWVEVIGANGMEVRHEETHRKTLDLEDWMERMRVSEEVRPGLASRILESTGLVREYLNPQRDGGDRFDLLETTIYAVKAG